MFGPAIESIALDLLVLAAKLWPKVREILAASTHPEAQRVVDLLPLESESAKVAAELRALGVVKGGAIPPFMAPANQSDTLPPPADSHDPQEHSEIP